MTWMQPMTFKWGIFIQDFTKFRIIRGDQIFNGFTLQRHGSKIFCQVIVTNVFKFPVGYKFGIGFGCFYA